MFMKSFASDNYAGAIPEVMEAIVAENQSHKPAYGNDNTTKLLEDTFSSLLQVPFKMHLVFNGTGANLFGLSCTIRPYSAILCAETAHIYVDESTAPEAFLGCRLIPLPVDNNGKLTTDTIAKSIKRQGDLHHPQATTLSIAQPTEYGTLYTLEELRQIRAITTKHGLLLHIDGARIFTAAAALGCDLKDIIAASGVDVISIGGTKAGMLYGEAVLIFNQKCMEHSAFLHKRSMQLASKNRFIAAQFLALLRHWKTYSTLSLEKTTQLKQVLNKYKAIELTKPVEANAIFARLPAEWIKPLQEIASFYLWEEVSQEVRLMCSFDTTEEEIDRFDKKLAQLNKDSVISNS